MDAEMILSITLTLYAQKILGVFAIVNPFSTIPIFVSLTVGYSVAERNKTARAASVAVFVILVVAFILGRYILEFFSISIASFRVAGGLLILMTAFSMLNARLGATKQTDEESKEAQNKENIAIIPLALPLMAGPGAISLMIISSNNTKTLVDHGSVILGVAAIALSVWIILNAGAKISKLLGTTGVNVATRLMGLILAAIAVEFIVSGLGEKFPGLLQTGLPRIPEGLEKLPPHSKPISVGEASDDIMLKRETLELVRWYDQIKADDIRTCIRELLGAMGRKRRKS